MLSYAKTGNAVEGHLTMQSLVSQCTQERKAWDTSAQNYYTCSYPGQQQEEHQITEKSQQ